MLLAVRSIIIKHGVVRQSIVGFAAKLTIKLLVDGWLMKRNIYFQFTWSTHRILKHKREQHALIN